MYNNANFSCVTVPRGGRTAQACSSVEEENPADKFARELNKEIDNVIRESSTLADAIRQMPSVFEGSILLDVFFDGSVKSAVEDFSESAAIFIDDEFGCDTISFELPTEAVKKNKNDDKFEIAGRAVLEFLLNDPASDPDFVAEIENDKIFITLTQKMIDEDLPSFVTSGCTREDEETCSSVSLTFSGYLVGQRIEMLADNNIKQKFISRFG